MANAAKPLVMDDGAFYQYAHHISQHPADPYGFEVFWHDHPEPANRVLAPPVLLYWWAAAQALFGESPLAWKLWLFPFALLLCLSLDRLLRRVAPDGRVPLLCLALLSPAILPAFNLMLDVPALALALAAVALLLEACDRDRAGALPVAAGLVAGLALQTKYSALLPFAAALGYALLAGRRRVALVAGALAAVIFVGWEALMLLLYGESHFANALQQASIYRGASPLQWSLAFLCLLGASAPAVGLLALGVLRGRILWLAGAAIVSTLAFAVIPLFPETRVGNTVALFPTGLALEAEALVVAALGVFVAVTTCLVVARKPVGALDLFLLLWLGLEVAGFFALSPYPALRRLIGVYVVLVLVIGRAAYAGGSEGRIPRAARLAVASWGSALGLLFYVSDLSDAIARRDGVGRTLAFLDTHAQAVEGGTRWYAGHWGFQYYAEASGLSPVVPDASRLERGDWLVVPLGVSRQQIVPQAGALARAARFSIKNPWPWSTLPGAYAGYRPIRPQPGAQLEIDVMRVAKDFVPATLGGHGAAATQTRRRGQSR